MAFFDPFLGERLVRARHTDLVGPVDWESPATSNFLVGQAGGMEDHREDRLELGMGPVDLDPDPGRLDYLGRVDQEQDTVAVDAICQTLAGPGSPLLQQLLLVVVQILIAEDGESPLGQARRQTGRGGLPVFGPIRDEHRLLVATGTEVDPMSSQVATCFMLKASFSSPGADT